MVWGKDAPTKGYKKSTNNKAEALIIAATSIETTIFRVLTVNIKFA
ncbi:hypothetical protein VIVU109784_22615 [Vibrio vulnificus]